MWTAHIVDYSQIWVSFKTVVPLVNVAFDSHRQGHRVMILRLEGLLLLSLELKFPGWRISTASWRWRGWVISFRVSEVLKFNRASQQIIIIISCVNNALTWVHSAMRRISRRIHKCIALSRQIMNSILPCLCILVSPRHLQPHSLMQNRNGSL